MRVWILIGVLFFIFIWEGKNIHAQADREYGKILSVSEKTVTVQFEQVDFKVGDEVEFWRYKAIIDPVTGNERGSSKSIIAKGVIDEIGLGKAFITITEQFTSERIDRNDRPYLTGAQKTMVRKLGKVQEITADKKMVIDLGKDDEISEGDTFLIQRSENIFDTKTKKITGANQIEVGKGKVESVKSKTSIASVSLLQPGMEVRKTDNVVFNPEQKAAPVPSLSELTQLRGEFESLKHEVVSLQVMVDSLGQNIKRNNQDFSLMKSEFERILPKLMSGDISGTKIVMKNAKPIYRQTSKLLFDRYKQALNDCLGHNYQKSTREFTEIIQKYPDSRLTENCRYWIALSSYSMGDYASAIEGFKTVIADTRFTHKDDDAAIMLGITYFQMGQFKDAAAAFRSFMEKYPDSEYKDKVSRWIEKLAATTKRG